MPLLADSSAVLEKDRMLVQHQAALTLLQGMLADPACLKLRWLDLACGKGQIIVHLGQNFSDSARAKINFVGYDVENSNSQHAQAIAESLGLASWSFEIGDLVRFHENGGTAGPWKFITLTNATHEISPDRLAGILANCIDRLADNGCLFIYDMESLNPPELGAIPWSASEMKSILTVLCRELGNAAFEPPVGRWKHKSCDCWNAQLHRNHLQLPQGYEDKIPHAVEATAAHIKDLLKKRLESADLSLRSLAEHGPVSGEEAKDKVNLLYEFWAVSDALKEET